MGLGIEPNLAPYPALPAPEVSGRYHKLAGGKELPTPLSGNRCAKTFIGMLSCLSTIS